VAPLLAVLWVILLYSTIAINPDSMPDPYYARRVRSILLSLAIVASVVILWRVLPERWPLWLRIILAGSVIPSYLLIVPLALISLANLRLALLMLLGLSPRGRRVVALLYSRHSGGLKRTTVLVLKPVDAESSAVGSYTLGEVESQLRAALESALPGLALLTWEQYRALARPPTRAAFALLRLRTLPLPPPLRPIPDCAQICLHVVTADGWDETSAQFVRPTLALSTSSHRTVKNRLFDEAITEVASVLVCEYRRLNC
jgi:hypothetical protein